MFTELFEPMDYLKDLLETNKGSLGLEFVGYGDEKLIPRYPAAIVVGSNFNRTLHGTMKFLLLMDITIWVYHAKMTISHQTRTKEDMLIVMEIRNLIHTKYTMDGNVIFGYIQNETPGVIQRAKSDVLVGTKVDWTGTSEAMF